MRTRLRGRALKGQRLHAAAPFGSLNTQTFIAGLTVDGLIAPWVPKGAMNGLAFETYIRTQLGPALEPCTVVILDYLATHRNVAAAQALKNRGCWILFLPPYSPDLNPTSRDIAAQYPDGQRLKWRFPSSRRICARTFDQLFDAIGDICDMFSPQECWDYLKAAGYASN